MSCGLLGGPSGEERISLGMWDGLGTKGATRDLQAGPLIGDQQFSLPSARGTDTSRSLSSKGWDGAELDSRDSWRG